PATAYSIARWLAPGSWKPVSRPSTACTPRPGWTSRRVNPDRATTCSSSVDHADSSARTTVVPMATTRPPRSRVALTASAARVQPDRRDLDSAALQRADDVPREGTGGRRHLGRPRRRREDRLVRTERLRVVDVAVADGFAAARHRARQVTFDEPQSLGPRIGG